MTSTPARCCGTGEVWLVDWDVCALNHPNYGLGTVATFVPLPQPSTSVLLAQLKGTALHAADLEVCRARRHAGLCG
ncbi:hypothetical protein [Deinococcus hopiensis]|uniref:hypothetical protein n=1 Tax=Deinococcus hopiensis TaxID=309885 RepID=UPI00111BE023|nr:hypothetical protein [Deinococcus hopiensis]